MPTRLSAIIKQTVGLTKKDLLSIELPNENYEISRVNSILILLVHLITVFNGAMTAGSLAWGVTEDAADPSLILEWFMVESWAEHLRQHRRVSKAAADLQEEVLRFHRGEQAPVVRHFLSVN